MEQEDEAVGILGENAREDFRGEQIDVEEGSVGVLGTLPLSWVGGSCNDGDEVGETLQSLQRWVMAWVESARGGFSRPPARPPPRTGGVGIKVGEYRTGGDGGGVGAAVARAEAVERRGLRRRGGLAVPAEVDTPAVATGSGASAVPDGMGEEGGTRCSCRDRVTSRGRGKGEKRRSGGGVWARVKGHPGRNFGDGRVGGGGAVGDKVRVGEGGCRCGVGGRSVGRGRR